MNKSSSVDDRVISLKVFAEKIGVDTRTFYRMIDRGTVPKPIKQGNKNYYFESDLVAYFNQLRLQRL